MRAKQFIGMLLAVLFLASLSFAQEKPKTAPLQKEKAISCAVCGMKMLPSQAGAKTTYKGKTYYFCSAREEAKFEKNPEKYLSKSEEDLSAKASVKKGAAESRMRDMPMRQGAIQTAIDPVCGMKVNPKNAKYKTTYQGKKFYFCARGDLEKFKKNPSKYVK